MRVRSCLAAWRRIGGNPRTLRRCTAPWASSTPASCGCTLACVCRGDRGVLVSRAIYLIGPSRQPHSLRDQDIWPTKRHVPPRRVGGPVGGCGHHCGLAETPLPRRRFRTGYVDTAVRTFARCRLRANAHAHPLPLPLLETRTCTLAVSISGDEWFTVADPLMAFIQPHIEALMRPTFEATQVRVCPSVVACLPLGGCPRPSPFRQP